MHVFECCCDRRKDVAVDDDDENRKEKNVKRMLCVHSAEPHLTSSTSSSFSVNFKLTFQAFYRNRRDYVSIVVQDRKIVFDFMFRIPTELQYIQHTFV